MPEMTFTIRWPDGSVDDCYSPSLVMHDHLESGADYTLEEFLIRSTTALTIASDRVREKFGFACTSAMAQQGEIEQESSRFSPTDTVRVLDLRPPLPGKERSS